MSSITTQLNNTLGTTGSGAANAATSAAANSTSLSATGAASSSGKDAANLMGTTDQFLNILLAQLKYQDPTQPMKGTEFIDSISRLSGVEQSINTNKYLENITSILKGSNSQTGNPVSYIDKTIDFNSSQIALTNHMTGFGYNLDSTTPPSNVTMTIKDASGKVVVNSQVTNKPGLNSVKWDGTDMSGNKLADGLYTISVQYPDPASKDPTKPTSIQVPTFTTGKVTGADFTGTDPTLSVGGISIPLTAIRKLYGSAV